MMYTDKQEQRDLLKEFRKGILDNSQSWEDFTKCRTNEQMKEINDMKDEIKELKNKNSRLEDEILRLKKMTITQRVKMRIKFILSFRVYKTIKFFERMTSKIYKLYNYLEVK